MPIWTYGIQIWGAAKPFNLNEIQAFQSYFQSPTNASKYVPNETLHSDFHINTVSNTASILYKRFRLRLSFHYNPLISQLNSNIIPGNPPKKLARR